MSKGRSEAAANLAIPLTVDTVLVYGRERMSFGVSKRCPASRLYENVSKGLGIQVTRVEHQHPLELHSTLIPNDPNVWLLEDCAVKNGSLLHIFGESGGQPQLLPGMVEMKLYWSEAMKEPVTFYVRQGSNVQQLLRAVRIQADVLPDSVKLFYQNKELSDLNAVPEWVAGETITMQGTYFPLSLVGGAHFAQNLGIYPSTECVICFEKMAKGNVTFFECGHGNVCAECAKVWASRKQCPVCSN